jgi:hypothetical protein
VVLARNTGFKFEEFRRLLPDRVLLVRLDDIFCSWQSAVDSVPNFSFPEKDCENRHISYSFDHHTYLSTIYKLWPANEATGALHIKLANDGFIYPPRSELHTKPHDQSRHGIPNWCVLDDDSCKLHFKSLFGFVMKYFQRIAEQIQFRVFYHEEFERIDFCFRTCLTNEKLVITFEPGFPISDDYDDADPWCALKL